MKMLLPLIPSIIISTYNLRQLQKYVCEQLLGNNITLTYFLDKYAVMKYLYLVWCAIFSMMYRLRLIALIKANNLLSHAISLWHSISPLSATSHWERIMGKIWSESKNCIRNKSSGIYPLWHFALRAKIILILKLSFARNTLDTLEIQ